MHPNPRPLLNRLILSLAILLAAATAGSATAQADDPTPPEDPVRLVFIHHSTGENWLQDGYGDLGIALDENNYFASDTNYGWGPDNIGDRTDIVNWPEWFGPERSQRALDRLYAEDGQHASWTRTLENPGGENEIILFKSCFPNSELRGSPSDPPAPGDYDATVSSAKYIYNLLLDYFLSRPDKMFVVITAPPVISDEYAENARAFNNWLVDDWLADYPGSNVFVFDFYNVLTGPDNHHWFHNGQIEHTTVPGMDTAYYPSGDDHPSVEGSRKATEEFIPLLNIFYHRWKSSQPYTPPAQADAQEEPAAPEEPPAGEEQQSPGAALNPGEAIAGLEDGTAWESQPDSLGSSLECFVESQVLQIDFSLAPDGYAGCGYSFETPQNWAESDGLSFSMQAEDVSTWFTVVLVTGEGENSTAFTASVPAPVGSDTGWQPVSVPWEAMEVAAWEEYSGQVFSPEHIVWIQFSFSTATEPFENTIRIRDLRLGAQLEAPAEAVPVAEAPSAAEEEPDQENEPVGGLRGLCPLSVALPLAAAGVALRSKHSRSDHAG